MTATSRRRFLQSLGVVASSGAVAGCRGSREPDSRPDEREQALPADVTWHKAPCRFCGTGCGVEVGVAAGKAVAVRGDTRNPVNKGLLCVKGYHLPGILYGADRLTRPQRRQADGSLQEISWDEALDLIAETFSKTLAAHGPDAVAMYGSGQWTVFDGYAASKWVKGGMRSNQLEPNARLCMASAVAGFITQFGSDEPMGCYDDFEEGDDFVLWGNNMAEMHPVLFSRILDNKRNNHGARIIDLGTRRTPTTHYADMYIEFKPGSDLALANGILHLLIARGHIDEAFIAENVAFKRGIEDVEKIGYGCFGDQADRYAFKDQLSPSSFDEFRAFVADYTPERVSELSGVSVAQLTALAEIYGARDRGTVSLWCMGVNQHYRGTWMNNLINNLHLITGKIGRPGSNPFSLTGQPSACGTAREVGTLANRLPADMVVTNPEHRAKAEQLWSLEPGTISAKPGYHAVDMFRAFVRGDIKAMWIQCTNPFVTMPNLRRFESRRDDQFLVVSEIYPTPTTDVADLILPSAAWIEREGIFGNSERRTQHWHKLVEPPGEATEDAWQIMQVARRMGMEKLFPWISEDAASDADWHERMYEEYRRFGVGVGKDLASYRQLVRERGARWPVVDGRETRYRYAAGHDPYVTKSAGVQFYKAKDQRAAVIQRPYHPPPEVPDEEYPFWLATGRVLEHWHTGSMTRRVVQLHQAVPEAYIELNPADATELGVGVGQRVRVVSRRGALELRVAADPRGAPPRGTVFVPFFDEHRLINRLTLDAMDNISKEPDYKKCAVRIERV